MPFRCYRSFQSVVTFELKQLFVRCADAVSFALCAKSASLRVQHLSELQSTDTDEPCQIKLEIASYRNDGNQRVFTLEARILPDSTRQYKLDGKLKTMKDVKVRKQDACFCFTALRRSTINDAGQKIHESTSIIFGNCSRSLGSDNIVSRI